MFASNYSLVNSYFSNESQLRSYGLESHVCYLGADIEKFKPQKDIKKERAMVSVGGINFHKRFDFVIKVASRVPEAIRPEVWIVGSRITKKL